MKQTEADELLMRDLMIYGKCVRRFSRRAWYNPMRWIYGEVKVRRLLPSEMFLKK